MEITLSEEEAENDPEAAAAAEEEEEAEAEENEKANEDDDEDDEDEEEQEKEDKEEAHPNAREPANDVVRALDAEVLKHQIRQREKMQKKYKASHKVVVSKEGDFVSMSIPKEDRAPADNLRMIVKILEVPQYSRHRVQSLYGIIKGLIPTRSLNVVAQQLIPSYVQDFENALEKEILLPRAAAEVSNADKVALACHCKKICTKRCICVKNGKSCSQYCHQSEIKSGNLPDTVVELTEAQLVPRIDYVGPLQAPKRKRAATTTSTEKPAAKKATSSRNQPSTATPATTRARARAKKGESLADPAQAALDGQLTMSQFEPFAPLAYRHTSAVKQLGKKRDNAAQAERKR